MKKLLDELSGIVEEWLNVFFYCALSDSERRKSKGRIEELRKKRQEPS